VEAYGTAGDMDLQDLVLQASLQPESQEAFRFIRLSLTHGGQGGRRKSFLVTSALPGEGKSLISLHLAVSLARAGKNALLVDADLNGLELTRMLMPDVPFGLTTLFEGNDSQMVESTIFPTAIDNLSFLPGGPAQENLADLLESGLMPEFIEEMSSLFDYVIFDTPAVGISMDAAALSRYVEGAYLVVRILSTEQKELIQAMEILNASDCPLLGSIVNAADVEGEDRYANRTGCDADPDQDYDGVEPSESTGSGYSDYAPEVAGNEGGRRDL
jgi:capsular exopolysaccharide synthesis family protein